MDANHLAESFPASIPLPRELRSLCDWVQQNGYPISGYFELREHDDETLRCWFGSDKAIGHLAQFGAGPDGSLYTAFGGKRMAGAITEPAQKAHDNFQEWIKPRCG